MEEAHRDRWVHGEAVKRIRWASPLLRQALHQDADNDLCESHHPGLVCENDVLELFTRKVRPQIRAGQEAACLWIIRWDLSAYNEGLNTSRLCQRLEFSAMIL